MRPNKDEKIAIVSMSCRFPGANTPQEFWNILEEGRSIVKDIPKERWDKNEFYSLSKDTPGKTNQKSGAFLEKIHSFDPFFFNISPKEAIEMSPSQKLMMELSWELIENSHIPYNKIQGSNTGVFIGNIWNDFENLRKQRNSEINSFSATGLSTNIIANRVSYFMGLTGPSFVVDTGCSSSLVALMLAVQALRDGSTDACITGGINHILNHEHYIYLSKFGGLSSNGKCSSFSAEADGFVRAEGAAVLLLKRLSDALRDGDNIHAVICGGAINNNGANDTMPATSIPGQFDLLERAYKNANITPNKVQYIETHGTGTKVGDPVEAKALGHFFANSRINGDKLIIGSVKTNFGHTEGAAGIAGVLKTVLSIEKGIIPKNLNFFSPNPSIDFNEYKLEILQQNKPWVVQDGRNRVAGVSSFGWGGTNAHIVLEQYRPIKNKTILTTQNKLDRYILPVSARSEEALKEYINNYLDILKNSKNDTKEHLSDFCASNALQKPNFEYRKAFSCENTKDLLYQLIEFNENNEEEFKLVENKEDSKVVFIFPGQGSQWLGMGKELYTREPVFKDTITECDKAFSKYVEWSLKEELFANETNSLLGRIDVVQPYLFAMQVALANLWISWGIKPTSVVGHSMGEVAAAFISGSITLNDAANVICSRSKLMNQLKGKDGAMAVTGLSEDRAYKIITKYNGKLSVAVENSPKSTVIAGSQTEISSLIEELEAKEIFVRQVKVDVASHSPQMDLIKEDLINQLKALTPKQATCNLYSSVKGSKLTWSNLTPEFWGENLRGTVKFSTIMKKLIEDEHQLFIEVSPHPVLKTPIWECIQKYGDKNLDVVTSLQREKPELIEMKKNLSNLFELGYSINKGNFFKVQGKNMIVLPSYPFQKENYEIKDMSSFVNKSEDNNKFHPILGKPVRLADSNDFYWESNISLYNLPLIKEHKVNEKPIFPASFYVEMIFAAIKQINENNSFIIESLQFTEPIALNEEKNVQIQLKINSEKDNSYSFKFYKFIVDKNEWVTTCKGKIKGTKDFENTQNNYKFNKCVKTYSESEFYSTFSNLEVEFGNSFRNVKKLQLDDKNNAIASINLNEEVLLSDEKYVIHPIIIDSCIQTTFSKVINKIEGETIKTAFVTKIERISLINQMSSGISYSAGIKLFDTVTEENTMLLKADLCLFDKNLEPIFELQGIEARINDTKIKKEIVDDKFNFSFLETIQTETNNNKRTGIIQEHLIKLVAKIIKAPINKIKSSMTFKNLGIDSIAMVMLKNLLEKDYEKEITVQKFKDYPSLRSFSLYLDNLINTTGKKGVQKVQKELSLRDRWFTKPLSNPNAKHQLFLIHDAGGNKEIFEHWHEQIDEEVEIILLQLPGRNDRRNEKAFNEVNLLIKELAPLMNEEISKPFSIFGHSMGGLIAFETARTLQLNYNKTPYKLMVSGTPCLKNYENKFVNYIIENNLSEKDIHALMPKFQRFDFEEEIVRRMIDVLLNDLKLIHSYKYISKGVLNSSIIAFHAINDVRVMQNDVEKWKHETIKNFKLIEVPGSHNYLYYDSELLIKYINKELGFHLSETFSNNKKQCNGD